MMVTSLNIFRFSLGNNSDNLDLDCVLHPQVLSEKKQQQLLTVCTLSLLKLPSHILNLHEVYM